MTQQYNFHDHRTYNRNFMFSCRIFLVLSGILASFSSLEGRDDSHPKANLRVLGGWRTAATGLANREIMDEDEPVYSSNVLSQTAFGCKGPNQLKQTTGNEETDKQLYHTNSNTTCEERDEHHIIISFHSPFVTRYLAVLKDSFLAGALSYAVTMLVWILVLE